MLATALFDRPAFRTCVSHGIVLGNDGQKMSKILRNYPDVNEVFDTLRLGRDALVPDGQPDPARRQPDRHRAGASARAVRQAILPLWNCWYFFALYANAEAYTGRPAR